jgi:aspartate/methionine/tyrosine aminotransferase
MEIFHLERIQSLYENTVPFNLTESGLHPYSLRELLTEAELADILNISLGYGQTNGSIPLREAICHIYPGANLNIDNVLVTNGSSEANFVATKTLLSPGDEVVMMLPNYMQIWGIARDLGAVVKPFYLKEDKNWHPDMAEVAELMSPKTKMICICNPNNPTGATLSLGEMKEFVRLAESVGAWIYADEIYRGAELDGVEIPSFMGMYDKVMVAGGLSKAYALPGLRIGWLAGPEKEVANTWAYHDYTSITAGILSHAVATKVLSPDLRSKVLSRSRQMLNENLILLQEWIARQTNQFHLVPPKAGGMAFIRYEMDMNSTELSDALRTQKGVFIVPGDSYGMDSFIRIGIGSKKEYLLKGLNLIARGIKEFMTEK